MGVRSLNDGSIDIEVLQDSALLIKHPTIQTGGCSVDGALSWKPI